MIHANVGDVNFFFGHFLRGAYSTQQESETNRLLSAPCRRRFRRQGRNERLTISARIHWASSWGEHQGTFSAAPFAVVVKYHRRQSHLTTSSAFRSLASVAVWCRGGGGTRATKNRMGRPGFSISEAASPRDTSVFSLPSLGDNAMLDTF